LAALVLTTGCNGGSIVGSPAAQQVSASTTTSVPLGSSGSTTLTMPPTQGYSGFFVLPRSMQTNVAGLSTVSVTLSSAVVVPPGGTTLAPFDAARMPLSLLRPKYAGATTLVYVQVNPAALLTTNGGNGGISGTINIPSSVSLTGKNVYVAAADSQTGIWNPNVLGAGSITGNSATFSFAGPLSLLSRPYVLAIYTM
jgi:hypothetical protein